MILTVNEVFLSVQGEGMRVGTANVFVRFTGCNLQCSMEPGDKSPGGFDCDTEFASGRKVSLDELHQWIEKTAAGWADKSGWLILTGGEPGLQITEELVSYLKGAGYRVAVETNGSIELPLGLDWITVSPKVAEHAIRQKTAHEVKYVRGYGQAVPKTVVDAENYLVSPAFNGLEIDRDALAWCVQLVKENPTWRLSPQMHKAWRIR